MKNLLIAVLVAIAAVQMSAQDVSFAPGSNNVNHFYADLVSKAASLNGDWGLFGGMRAGYNINKNVSVGLVGHGLIPNKLEALISIRREEMNFTSAMAALKLVINMISP